MGDPSKFYTAKTGFSTLKEDLIVRGEPGKQSPKIKPKKSTHTNLIRSNHSHNSFMSIGFKRDFHGVSFKTWLITLQQG
jgi:hypothetical protein